MKKCAAAVTLVIAPLAYTINISYLRSEQLKINIIMHKENCHHKHS